MARNTIAHKCDHCSSIDGIKAFEIGRKEIHICYSCAFALMRMQKVVKEWVE